MPVIAINDFVSVRGISGSSRGSALIGAALATADSVHTLTPRAEPGRRPLRLANMLWWDFVAAPSKASRLGAQCIIHATNTGGSKGSLPSIVVMHDTMVLDHPDLFDRGYRCYAQLAFAKSARGASLIVTPSHHSASRIEERWPKARAEVVPWPAAHGLNDTSQAPSGLPSKEILVVSSSDRHKRLDLAVRVVARLREDTGEDFSLTLVSRPGNGESELRGALQLHDPERRWSSRIEGISDAELLTHYKRAFAVMVPSLDEGYCLPAIEATSAGTAVVHCNRGALPEVVPRVGFFGEGQSDEDSLIAQLAELLDPQTRPLWVNSAREHNARASFDSFARRWRTLVHEVIA